MAEQSTKSELALAFGRNMNELRMQFRKYMQGRIRSMDMHLTYEMLEVMICLWRQDGVNQQLIADITLRDKSAMTYLVDNLIKRKMILRKEDERDRRNKLIFLTPEGKELQERLQPWVAEMYDRATVGVDAATLLNGKELVENMIKNLSV